MANEIITMAEYRATLNGQPFDQGAASMQQSAAGVATSLDKVSESSNRVTAATAVSTSGFERLLASLDKNVAMADAYQAKLDQLNRLHDAGQVSAGQYSVALQAINEKYSGLSSANDNATRSVSGFSGVLNAGKEVLGAFGLALSIGGLVEFGRGALDSAAAVKSLAAETGTSLAGFQAFRATLEESGVSSEQAVTSLARLNRAIGEAEQGNKTALGAFQQLNISMHDLAGGPESVMPKVASALLQIGDSSARAQIETALFGRSGQVLEAALNSLKNPINELINEQTQLGHVMGDDVVTAANKAESQLTGAWHRIEADLTPLLARMTTGVADLIDMLTKVPSTADRMNSEAFQHLLSTGQSPRSGVNIFGLGGSSATSIDSNPVTTSDIQDQLDAVTSANIDAANKVLDAWKETHEAVVEFWDDANKAIDASDQKAAEAAQKISDDIIAYYDKVAEKLQETENDQALALQKLLNTYSTAGYGMLAVGADPVAAEAQKFADEEKKAQEEAAKASDEYWNRMFDNSFRSGQTFFTNLFAHGKASLSGFLTDFEQMFGTMLSDLALKAIAKPIIMPIMEQFAGALGIGPAGASGLGSAGLLGSLGLGGLFGTNGASQSAIDSQMPGTLGLGGYLGSGLLGAGLGSVSGSLFGGNSTGSALGGALGGIAGNLLDPVLGPFGPVVGSLLGGALGGLFGGKPSNYTAYANFGSDLSLTGGLTGDKPNSTTLGLAGQVGQSVSAAAKSLEAAGVDFSNTIKQIQIGSRDQSRLVTGSGATLNIGAAGNVSAATAGALNYLLTGASSSDASVQAVIDKYREAGKLTADNATAMVNEITAVKQKASDLDSFVKSTSDNILKFTNPVLEGWTALMNVEDARLKQAQTLGADVSNLQTLNFHEQLGYLNQLNDTQRAALGNLIGLAGTLAMTVANTQSAALMAVTQQLTLSQQFASQMRSAASQYGGAATSLGNAGNALLVGNLSPLSPADQYSAARSSLEQTFATASHGDVTALNGLSGAANTFLQQSLAFNGATAQYSRDFQYVQSLLAQGQKVASASADAAAKLADLADQQVSLLQEISTELKGPSPDRDLLQKQVDALNKIQDSANQTVLRLNDQLAAIAGQSSDIAAAYYSASAQAAAKITGTVDESGKQVQTGLGQVNDAVQKSADDIATSVTLGSDLTVGAVFQSSIGTQLQSALNIDGVTSALDKFISALDDAAAHIAGTPLTPSAPVSTVTTPAGVPVDQAFAAAVQASINNDFSLILRTTQRPSNRDAVSATNSAIQNDLLAAFAGGSISTPSQQASLADAIQRMGDTIASSNGSLAQSITDLRAEQAALRRLLTTAA